MQDRPPIDHVYYDMYSSNKVIDHNELMKEILDYFGHNFHPSTRGGTLCLSQEKPSEYFSYTVFIEFKVPVYLQGKLSSYPNIVKNDLYMDDNTRLFDFCKPEYLTGYWLVTKEDGKYYPIDSFSEMAKFQRKSLQVLSSDLQKEKTEVTRSTLGTALSVAMIAIGGLGNSLLSYSATLGGFAFLVHQINQLIKHSNQANKIEKNIDTALTKHSFFAEYVKRPVILKKEDFAYQKPGWF